MKSEKARRSEILRSRKKKREKTKVRATQERLRNKVRVNNKALSSTNSYGTPDFVDRGYYEDIPFACKDCGKNEIWRDTQQKWWYEVAKGDVWQVAVRCRPCRRNERERKNEARRIHEDGIAQKRET